MNNDEMQAFLAADAALTTTKPWELEIRSAKMRQYAIIAAAVTVAVHVFLALIVTVGDTGVSITRVDQVGYFMVGLLLGSVFYVCLSRPRVRVNADGVDVRNFIGSRFFPWQVIYGLNFPSRAKVARLELPEFEYVPLWAMVASDGPALVQAMKDFRALEAKYMPED